jgi:hypothetical protein
LNWITPQLGGLVAAITVPLLIILYFLKLRRQDVEVSSTFLWKKAIQDLQANAPFQKLRRNLLLFLQLIILGGLCFALAQPQVKGQAFVGNRHVILIDRSASMQALDEVDGKGQKISRFEAARQQAVALVESLGEGGLLTGKDTADEAMVISFDSAAEVRQQFTTDKRALKTAIEALTPTEGPTLAEEAFRLAQAHKPRRLVEGVGMESGPPMTIHLFSDGRIPDATKAKSDRDDPIQYRQLGKPESPNLAVVGLRAAREYDNPTRVGIYVSLQNNQTQPRRVDVELLVDGVSSRIKNTTIAAATVVNAPAAAPAQPAADGTTPTPAEPPPPAPGTGGLVFSLDMPESAVIQVRLRDTGLGGPLTDDVLELDDRAFLVVPPAKKLAVLVVSKDSDSWLDVALSGLPLSRLTKIDPPKFGQWTQEGRLGEFDVVILENWVPSAAPSPTPGTNAAPAQLPPGSYLIMGGVVGQTLGMKELGKTPPAGIVDWSSDHPALRNVSLAQLKIAEMRRVELIPASGAQTLVMSDEGPAMIEASINGVHAITLPFRIDDTRWALNPSFVVFVGAAIRYLGEDVGAGSTVRDVQPGSVVNDRLPAGASDIRVKLPSGESQELKPASDGRITFGPLTTSGVYEVSWTGAAGPTDRKSDNTASRGYAANLGDTAESDLGARTQVGLGTDIAVAQSSRSTQADRRLWPYLVLLAIAVAMAEWFIYNRKVYI